MFIFYHNNYFLTAEKSFKNSFYWSINDQDSFPQFYAMTVLPLIYSDFGSKYVPKNSVHNSSFISISSLTPVLKNKVSRMQKIGIWKFAKVKKKKKKIHINNFPQVMY